MGVFGLAVAAQLLGNDGSSEQRPPAAQLMTDASSSSPTSTVYYPRCAAARAARAAPIYEGEPGYRPELDGDGDGIACEPYYGR